MSFSKLASSLALLTIFLLFKFKPTFGVHPLFHICSSNHQNFTANDPYETNLKELTLYLSHETATKGSVLVPRVMANTKYMELLFVVVMS